MRITGGKYDDRMSEMLGTRGDSGIVTASVMDTTLVLECLVIGSLKNLSLMDQVTKDYQVTLELAPSNSWPKRVLMEIYSNNRRIGDQTSHNEDSLA